MPFKLGSPVSARARKLKVDDCYRPIRSRRSRIQRAWNEIHNTARVFTARVHHLYTFIFAHTGPAPPIMTRLIAGPKLEEREADRHLGVDPMRIVVGVQLLPGRNS